MNRLLQGDVGSGKTIVALMAMLLALDNNRVSDGASFQACLMAPTEILAQQHILSLKGFFESLGIPYALLTGSIKSRDRKQILEKLIKGEISVLIGTHALIEDSVKFKNLGLAVIDEQHRFGVGQSQVMAKKRSGTPCFGNDGDTHPQNLIHDPLWRSGCFSNR